ncbi:MAG: pyridoxamine 5'-phosphate oxidase family protein [Oligosphaeraceae bacterium]
MRRKDREILDPRIFREILEENNTVFVALVDQGLPYGILMHYAPWFSGDSPALILHCAKEGRKIECLRQSPRACLFIHDKGEAKVILNGDRPSGRTTTHYRSLMLQGTMRFLPDGEEKRQAARILLTHFAPKGGEIEMPPESALEKTEFLLFQPEEITGKSNPGPGAQREGRP